MAFLRQRASGNYALSWKWKGKSYIKGLGTKDFAEAERIKQDADDQLARIRRGESALASKLLADGHSIVDVLFGSEDIGHLTASPTDDNPLTISQLKEAFVDNLRATGRTPGHVEGTKVHLDHFIRVLGDVRVMSLSDADLLAFKKSREKEKSTSNRLISQGTIRSDFKSLKSAINWAIKRNPPLLSKCPFTIPKITAVTVKPFLPSEEIKRLIDSSNENEKDALHARWLLDLKEINSFVEMIAKKMPEMLLPIKLVCSTGMRRIQLIRLRPSDYVNGRLMITSKKGAREKGLSEITLTIELRDAIAKEIAEHVKELPKRSRILFPVFDQLDYSGSNQRWKDKSTRSLEQRQCDRADRLFEKLVKGTEFRRLDGYHALRHSFISILVAQGKTWDQIAAFVGHLDQRTTQRYIHFLPKDKRETANSIPFEF